MTHTAIEAVGPWKHRRGQPELRHGARVEIRVRFEDSFPQVGCLKLYYESDSLILSLEDIFLYLYFLL